MIYYFEHEQYCNQYESKDFITLLFKVSRKSFQKLFIYRSLHLYLGMTYTFCPRFAIFVNIDIPVLIGLLFSFLKGFNKSLRLVNNTCAIKLH